ncbi:MAG: hypothetical protein NC299_11940 [Lachnospiraceae bacterium]|nr:hypothetical protein [Lachnospiraceae bacterium]
MKFTEKSVAGSRIEFLASAKWQGINHTFEADTKSGALVEVTDGLGNKYKGICAYDVTVADNPNGTVVVLGIVKTDKLPAKPTSSDTMFPTLIFV